MKRDMELVRDILARVEEARGPVDASALADGRRDFDAVAWHFSIMDQAGLIKAEVRRSWEGDYLGAEARELTWAGAEFLASVRDKRVWDDVKRAAARSAADLPFSILGQLAAKVAAGLVPGL